MIIHDDLGYITHSEFPNTDWTDGEARYVVDDNSELAAKVMSCAPFFEPIEDGDGNLIDIVPLPRPEPEPLPEPFNPIAALTSENALLKDQITDLQLALCEMYESVISNGTEAST